MLKSPAYSSESHSGAKNYLWIAQRRLGRFQVTKNEENVKMKIAFISQMDHEKRTEQYYLAT